MKDDKTDVKPFLEIYRTLLSPRLLAILVLITIIAAVAGPFGTFSSMGFGMRVIYWGLVAFVSTTLSITVARVVRALGFVEPNGRHIALRFVFATILITIAVWLITVLGPWGVSPPMRWQRLLFYVALVVTGVNFLRFVLRLDYQPHKEQSEQKPLLCKRLPEGQDCEILHLSVEDHHVEIHTDRGAVSMRMRLGDAIEEMDGVPGLRVHRSHWVARHAILRVERVEGRYVLFLTNGQEVPVSRSYRSVLEEDGLI